MAAMRLQVLARLLSLSRHQTCGSIVEIQRHAATQAAATAEDRKRYQEKINAYHKERVEWKRQMTELRKKWLQDYQEVQQAGLAEARQQKEKELEHQMLSKAAVQQDTENDTKLQQLTRALEDAELAHKVALDRLKRVKREMLRKQILQEHDSKRFEELEEQSKHWITPDTLDAKISEILDSPASLDPPPVPVEGGQAA